jgi:hypothetical protein
MDQLDQRISKRLQKIIRRVERLALSEIGEEVGIVLIVLPWTRTGEDSREAELQYISNVPRSHMHGALKALVKKWDAGAPDIPPHLKQ